MARVYGRIMQTHPVFATEDGAVEIAKTRHHVLSTVLATAAASIGPVSVTTCMMEKAVKCRLRLPSTSI